MKYKELIHFEPITSVIKLISADDITVAEKLVRSFVFSQNIKADIKAVVANNLSVKSSDETLGIQIVGSYGTGKSHLMSVVSALAENRDLMNCLTDDSLADTFSEFAGHYKVLRFELATNLPLNEIIVAQFNRYLDSIDVKFELIENPKFGWKEQLSHMMAAFEEVYPDKHFLVVIDEMLEYLKGRGPTELNVDLVVLRSLGEACDKSRFKFIFGVQEMLYRVPEFQFLAEMLNKVADRYSDLHITKEDVSFVVKERLLKKDLHQKNAIRDHLLKFSHLFEGINTNLNEYVDLFPVHPNYISNFEQIRHGKSQREILKVLSHNFEQLLDSDLPAEAPGLITYDTYWPELVKNTTILAIPDIRMIKDKVDIILDHINNHFVGARANKKALAVSICNSLAIKILCDDLDKKNGASANSLKEDLCQTLPGVNDPELLTDNVENTAKMLITATSGQYVEQDSISSQFHIRTEGGINIPQRIRDFADAVVIKTPDLADQYFFDFLQYILGLQQNTYRTGFKIWEHSLEWLDKKSFRLGYIFFGNPNERSTTEPIQQYYFFFCPLFNASSRNDEADEVYFDMTKLSDEFKDTICLFGAAKSLESNAPSNQKPLFRNYIEEYNRKAIALFEKEYADKTTVIYKGNTKPLRNYPLPGEGSTKEMIFSNVASRELNKHFNDKYKGYPAFKDLQQPLTKENFDGRIKSALKKIVASNLPNRDGEAILAGLGLWSGQNIDLQNSKYADSIRKQLKDKGTGKVLNKDEILYYHSQSHELWYSVDFNIDYQLEFIVLGAMAFKGDIEITLAGGKSLSAVNIDALANLSNDDFYTFLNVKEPQGIPVKNLKALFTSLGLPDLTSELEKPETITSILTESKKRVEKVVTVKAVLANGLKCRNVSLLKDDEALSMRMELDVLAAILDGIQSYNTYGKLKSFRYTEEDLKTAFAAYPYCEKIDKLSERAYKFDKLIGYLYTAQSYVVEGEKPLFDDIVASIARLGIVMQSGNETDIRQYDSLLNSMVDKYTDYYISQYAKCRLSATDALAKERILSSDSKKICDCIKDVEFIMATEYENWVNSITSLRAADSSLTKAKVKLEPYHDFNPREYYGKANYKIAELEDQLNAILEKWVIALRSVLRDPTISEYLDLLPADDKTIIESFRDEKLDISADNAQRLRNLISQLAQGIDKVEFSLDDFRKKFNKPLSPPEAITALTAYINDLCAGKERNKVRIIIK